MELKKKIFKVEIIDIVVDDVVVSYLDCDLDKVVSLISEFNGFPRRLIITQVLK